ncbi:MAG: hypothetical protein ACOCUI_02510 [bacterium]
MNYNDQEYCDNILATILGWRLKGAQTFILLCIYRHLTKENKKTVRITIEDFMRETHYSKQSVISSLQSLIDRSIIEKKISTQDNKSYEYSIIEYEMEEKKSDDIMKENIKKGRSAWDYSEKSDTKKAKKIRYRKVSVDDWNYNDFSFFVCHYVKFIAKYKKIKIDDMSFVLNSSFVRNQNYLNTVDFLNRYSGNNFCKLLLKAYLEWYINEIFFDKVYHDMKILNGKKQFTIGLFSNKYYMQEFLDAHNIDENISNVSGVESKLKGYSKKINPQKSKKKYLHAITEKDMKKYYKSGISTILLECGIVLTGNYLIKYENKTQQEAGFEIMSFLNSLNLSHKKQREALIKVAEKTCLASPYHDSLKFLNWHILYSDIFNKLGEDFSMENFEVTGNKNRDSYKFLSEKEKIAV